MQLNHEELKKSVRWETKGYRLPLFDRDCAAKQTRCHPRWIHFGAGNIFRSFQAKAAQTLLDQKLLDSGMIAAEGYDCEIIEKIYRPHDNYSILVTLKADGTMEKTVIGSVTESLILDKNYPSDFARLRDIFLCDSLQMASFTITEKGYLLKDENGIFTPQVQADLLGGPDNPESYMGKIVSLLYERCLAGQKPIAMVSMDNCSHNGTKLYQAVHTFAEIWTAAGHVSGDFLSYINNPKKVSFPWTMIDKITPRPDLSVKKVLLEDGLEGITPVVTSKNTYIAPFVNAEECEYLVVEDDFPNGRPPLEKAGFIFTDRETVDKTERMKVCTCLNPLHTALAVFGCLLGYGFISAEMKNPVLKRLVVKIGYEEGLPAVTDPGILSPREFLDKVIDVRLPNPFMPDTPQRIATDTSQKLAIRFGKTIQTYMDNPQLTVSSLKFIPLVLAGWLRYLMAVDDEGTPFALSPDPLLDTLCPYLSALHLGDRFDAERLLRPILENKEIFGTDLYAAGLTDLICRYFTEMTAHKGAVKKTLEKYVMK